MAMEFWGVEVKPGESLKVKPDLFKIIHISQAALGEMEKGKRPDSVPIRVHINNKNHVIGFLSGEDRPQMMFDLVFEKEFELSHDWKHGSVYFVGYMTDDPCGDDEFDSDDEISLDDDDAMDTVENGDLDAKIKETAKKAIAAKHNAVMQALTKKDAESESDEDSDEADKDSSDDMSTGLGSDEFGESSDFSDEDESEEEMPKKPGSAKKKPSESALRTPVPAKSGGKKGNPMTSPPSKPAGKTPTTGKKFMETNTGGKASKRFHSGSPQKSHKKAKHGAK